MGLRWSNVDCDEGRIVVTETAKLPGRIVPVTAVVLADVRKLPVSTLV